MEDKKPKEKYYRCKCGTKNPITATFCSKCNESLSMYAEVIIPDEEIVDGPISHIEIEEQIVTQQQNPPVKEKKSKKKWIVILLIVLGIALIVAAGIFVMYLIEEYDYDYDYDYNYGKRPIYSSAPSDEPDRTSEPTIEASESPNSTFTNIPIIPTEEPNSTDFWHTIPPYITEEPTSNPTGVNSWKYNRIKAVQISTYNYEDIPSLKVFDTPYNCSQIISVTFLDYISVPTGYNVYDISKYRDNSVVCWFKGDVYYDMFIAADGGINGAEAKNLFYGYTNVREINFNNCFHTDYAKSFSAMFDHCYHLKSVDVETLNTNSVEDMSFMFSRCRTLETLDLTNFNTNLVTNMRAMFQSCYVLDSIKGVDGTMFSSFDTSKVSDMGYMFFNCENLNDVSYFSFDTSSVKNMDYMFYNCFIPKSYPDDFIEAVEMFYDVSNVVAYEGFMDKTGWESLFAGN